MYSRVPPFQGSTSRWRGVIFKLKMPQKASPYSPMNLAQKLGSPSTIDFLLGGNRVPYNKLEAQPTKGSGAPKRPQKASTATKGVTGHKRRLGSKDPRVTSSRTFTSTNLRGESKPMHKSKCKNTRSAQVLHSQIPPKATNAYGGRREEEQRRELRKNSKIQIQRVPLTQRRDGLVEMQIQISSHCPSKICKNHGRD